jgi:hypothetical protein
MVLYILIFKFSEMTWEEKDSDQKCSKHSLNLICF